jgi:D-alanyl-D-alanine carboxypeptidase
LCGVASGESSGSDVVQRALELLVADGAPCAIADLRVGGRCWSLSTGVSNLQTRGEVAASSRVRIGSVTKTFTATLVLQLIGEGRLGLDDTVERWLPGLVPGGEAISVHHLLDHRSGLYNHTDDLDPADFLRDRYLQWQTRDVVTQATRHPALFAPGTSRSYCNTGYLLLGLIVENVSGERFEDEMTRRILAPLDLTDTMVGTADVLPGPHLHGYLSIGDDLVDMTACNSSLAWAAGGMVSTPADLNRFYAALFAGDLLRTAEKALMLTNRATTNPDVDTGLGIFLVRLPNGAVVWGKDGGFFGYHTWSFHTVGARHQLTVSISVGRGAHPSSHGLLAGVASAFADA